jgi:hypothetical protein
MTTDLFNDELQEGWREHWVDMPEFVQEDLTPYRTINVRFRNEEDVLEFEKLMNQKITPKIKTIWFPFAKPRKRAHLRYVDES